VLQDISLSCAQESNAVCYSEEVVKQDLLIKRVLMLGRRDLAMQSF